MKRIQSLRIGLFMFALAMLSSLATYGNSLNPTSKHIIDVIAITEVFGDGQKVTAVAVEFDKKICNSALSNSSFSVMGRTIAKVYSNSVLAKGSEGVDGKYVIIELSVADKEAAVFSQHGPRFSTASKKIAVKQLTPVITVEGEKYTPDSSPIENDRQINLVVDDFQQLEYNDPQTGKVLKYNLFIPKNYNSRKTYPMVLFIHDAGVTSAEPRTTLIQGLGAVIWATPSEQAKHECFVLAPQYNTVMVNDQSEASNDLDIVVNLITDLENRYTIDKNRLYTTGQSMGCMSSIALNIKYPDLFAASLLVAGQWDPAKVPVMAKDNLWIIVSEGDLKAFPGMNAITETLEKAGAKISRATWSGLCTPAEFKTEVDNMVAEGNNVKYTVLRKGTVVTEGMRDDGGSNHICTWKIAYTIEGVRDWLFTQKR